MSDVTPEPLPQHAFRPDTIAVRGGLARSNFDETSEALYLTSGFVYESAEQAEAAFKDEVDHFIYSRYGNPTVTMFEQRLKELEGAEACFATASGMSAVFVALAALLGQGDRVVSSRGLFGSCFVILD
jgi:O-succinylhomoserine sulfhydrylase